MSRRPRFDARNRRTPSTGSAHQGGLKIRGRGLPQRRPRATSISRRSRRSQVQTRNGSGKNQPVSLVSAAQPAITPKRMTHASAGTRQPGRRQYQRPWRTRRGQSPRARQADRRGSRSARWRIDWVERIQAPVASVAGQAPHREETKVQIIPAVRLNASIGPRRTGRVGPSRRRNVADRPTIA